jgi:hypothetical protein
MHMVLSDLAKDRHGTYKVNGMISLVEIGGMDEIRVCRNYKYLIRPSRQGPLLMWLSLDASSHCPFLKDAFFWVVMICYTKALHRFENLQLP